MRRPQILLLAALCAAQLLGCAEGTPTSTTIDEIPLGTGSDDSTSAPTTYNPDWTDATHTKITPPTYAVVFPQDSVNRIEITITAAQWTSVRNDMRRIWGVDFGQPRPGGNFPAEDPAYIAVPVRFNGRLWKKVGWRLKGNSTLHSAWTTGNFKLPFRLKTNEFEDLMPAIKGQRVYGFKELSFSPGRSDNALIREKVTADIFRLGGIPAARTAMYRVFIDFGAGMRYVGVYTVVEVIDDTMVKDQFGSDAGNLYKPESALRSFVEAEFEKKNNKTSSFADVQALITTLNSTQRATNPPAWRTSLEAVFNVDHFLKWLAIDNAIVNWDSYGTMAQNYYLYNHPTTRLTWIPWDHNEAMIGSPSVTGGAPGPGNRGLSLTMNEVGPQWPLIRNLIDDPVYAARYREHLRTFNSGVFSQSAMDALFTKYHAMITPFVIGANGEQPGATYLANPNAFLNALQELKTHVANRKVVIGQFIP
jgi:spore coat protein H